MAPAPVNRQPIYGQYQDHEKQLEFRSMDPLHDRKPTPEPIDVGDYRINFTEKIFGGYLANIVRKDGVVVARKAKITRFIQKEYYDASTDTTVYVKLTLIDGEALLLVTAFKEAADETKGR